MNLREYPALHLEINTAFIAVSVTAGYSIIRITHTLKCV